MNNGMRRDGWRLGGSFVAAAATAAVLHALGQLLTLPSGYGVEDLLGWTGAAGPQGPVGQMLAEWQRHLDALAPWIPGLYLGLDIAVFMPLYGLVFTGWWWQAQRDFAAHSGRGGEWCGWLVRAGSALVLALWLVDLVENLAGLARIELIWVGLPALLGAALVVAYLRRCCDRDWLSGLWRAASPAGSLRRWLWWVAVLGVALLLAGPSARARSACFEATHWAWTAGCLAHGMKTPLIALLALGPLLLAVWVQYGPHADTSRWPRVVAVRSALVGLLWRTRYVLIALVACAALMLVMDQGRDVVYAMASHWRQGGGTRALIGTLLALGLTALALWILGHSCWLWSRLALRVASRRVGPRGGEPQAEDHLAKFWARLLGVAPSLLVLGMVLAVLPQAVVLKQQHEPIIVLLVFATLVVVLSVSFIWKHDRLSRGSESEPLYYASYDLRRVIDAGLKYHLFGRVSPVLLPAFALAVALACRALGQWGGESLPTLTLPVMFCLVAFWLGIAGWISLYEESESVPWFLFTLVVVGALGTLGCTENHRVPVAPGGATLAPDKAMLVTLALGAVLMGVSVLVAWLLSSRRATLWNLLGCAALLLGGSYAVVLKLTNRVLPPQEAPATGSPVEAGEAVQRWLQELCPGENAGACAAGGPVPVYLVMAEGGGIRSAYWTALVLARLHAAGAGAPDFDRHTFAMTGVSGGALGIAVYRACRLVASREKDAAAAKKALGDCIDRFGRADLLAPLVGAWFFEDAVARWLPLRCERPGCGMLSRGLWFEGAMLQALPALPKDLPPLPEGLPALSSGLAASREALVQAVGGHQPYLLLNSTWVETGERTLASELVIDWHDFPGARDQLAMLGQPDLPLVTAAHNSARFPFTNALGAVHAPKGRCEPNAYRSRRQPETSDPAPCGHLADGGYFDNSGGHTAADLLRLLQRCLSDGPKGSAPLCPKLSKDSRDRLARRLEPHVFVIRNGVGLGPLPVDACPREGMPDAALVAGKPQAQDPIGLRQPRCAKHGQLFIDALGPAWAAFGAIGTGANGRLASARPGLEGCADVHLIDLRDDGPLYPLGWHLSPAARQEMRLQADDPKSGVTTLRTGSQPSARPIRIFCTSDVPS